MCEDTYGFDLYSMIVPFSLFGALDMIYVRFIYDYTVKLISYFLFILTCLFVVALAVLVVSSLISNFIHRYCLYACSEAQYKRLSHMCDI